MTETRGERHGAVARCGARPVLRTWATATVALLAIAGAGCGSAANTSPGIQPTTTSEGITAGPAEPETGNGGSSNPVNFARLLGWIAYGAKEGIWAVDPKRPGHHLRLTDEAGDPLAWSSDGSKLLILRQTDPQKWPGDLFVLNADGSEARLTDLRGRGLSGGSFSPDGSQVLYSTTLEQGGEWRSVVWLIDAAGGTPQPLFRKSRDIAHPAFSPDGEQIAFVAGWGDSHNKFMVMNADGSHPHVVLGPIRVLQGHVFHLAWSPDGTRLAFDADSPPTMLRKEIYTFNPDGTGLMPIRPGWNPDWSSDGSRIAFVHHGVLYTMAADGTDLQAVRGVGLFARAIAWNRSRDA